MSTVLVIIPKQIAQLDVSILIPPKAIKFGNSAILRRLLCNRLNLVLLLLQNGVQLIK
jgi:hypothetical protein